MLYVWVALFIVFAIVEAATVSLVTVWFAAGSLAAAAVMLLGGSVLVQIIVFLAVSGIVMAFLRPLLKRYINAGGVPTNADRVIGQTGSVTEKIDNVLGTGAVEVDGKVWTARSLDGACVEAGTLVRPVSIQGVKLIVEPAMANAVN